MGEAKPSTGLPPRIHGPIHSEIMRLPALARSLATSLGLALLSAPAVHAAQGCQPDVLDPLGVNGVRGTVHAVAFYDDGSGVGPQLYAGGEFDLAGTVPTTGIARWDGTRWWDLGAGVDGVVLALAVHDEGSGPVLFVGGDFDSAGGVPANHLARWDGSTWSAVGGGTNGAVRALAQHTDPMYGTGLYVGGDFTNAGGLTAPYLARWQGGAWSSLAPNPLNGPVHALLGVEFLPGHGTNLVAGGEFTHVGGMQVGHVARWQFGAWAPFATGVSGTVLALALYEEQQGMPRLYVGGDFLGSGSYISRWMGAYWQGPGGGMDGPVRALTVHRNFPGGPASLYVGGDFLTAGGLAAQRLARWDGQGWFSFVNADAPVRALAQLESASGGVEGGIYAGGEFDALQATGAPSPTVPCDRIARLRFPHDVRLLGNQPRSVEAVGLHDDGTSGGARMYVATQTLSSFPTRIIARLEGKEWTSAVGDINGPVHVMGTFDYGNGPTFLVGGGFTSLDGLSVTRLAGWDGTSWSDVGFGGLQSAVRCLATFDTGLDPNPHLLAGMSDVVGGSGVGLWDGTAWSPIFPWNTHVVAMKNSEPAFEPGPALYAAGSFTIALSSGATCYNIIKLIPDPTYWFNVGAEPLGLGTTGIVSSLEFHDDGSGAGIQLYVGGNFQYAYNTDVDAVYAPYVARWNGTTWSAVGTGPAGAVSSLAVYDDGTGSGPQLYATHASGAMSKWDGIAWTSATSAAFATSFGSRMAVHDGGVGGGPELWAPTHTSPRFRFGGCSAAPSPCSGSVDGPSSLALQQCGSLQGAYTVTSDGALGAGSWSIHLSPGFPFGDGWSVSIDPTSGPTTTLTFSVPVSATTGSWPIELRWDGTCNGQPASWARTIDCSLQLACVVGTPYCFGDGSGTPCPCSNFGGPEGGCANSTGSGGRLSGSGSASVSLTNLVLHGTNLVPGHGGLYFQGTTRAAGGNGVPFGDGLLCTGGSTVRLQLRNADASGSSQTTLSIAATGGVAPGDIRTYQLWYRDPTLSPCQGGFNLTQGLEILWLP